MTNFPFAACLVLTVEITRHLTDNWLFVVSLAFGEGILAMDLMGEWEDLLLDKDNNVAIVTSCTWLDRLFSSVIKSSSLVMKLHNIVHVGLSVEKGLFMLHRNGKTACISTRGLTRDEIQEMKREVCYFLDTHKLEYLDRQSPPIRQFLVHDASHVLRTAAGKRPPSFEEASSCCNPPELDKCVIKQQLSTPSLMTTLEKEAGKTTIKRGPYTKLLCTSHVTVSKTRL